MIDTVFTRKLERFIQFADTAKLIAKSAVSWETKYDLIFSDDINGNIRSFHFSINWIGDGEVCKKDEDYKKKDILSYIAALSEKAKEIQIVLDETKVRTETSGLFGE